MKKQGVGFSDKLEARAVEHRSPSYMKVFQSSPWSLHLLLEQVSPGIHDRLPQPCKSRLKGHFLKEACAAYLL